MAALFSNIDESLLPPAIREQMRQEAFRSLMREGMRGDAIENHANQQAATFNAGMNYQAPQAMDAAAMLQGRLTAHGTPYPTGGSRTPQLSPDAQILARRDAFLQKQPFDLHDLSHGSQRYGNSLMEMSEPVEFTDPMTGKPVKFRGIPGALRLRGKMPDDAAVAKKQAAYDAKRRYDAAQRVARGKMNKRRFAALQQKRASQASARQRAAQNRMAMMLFQRDPRAAAALFGDMAKSRAAAQSDMARIYAANTQSALDRQNRMDLQRSENTSRERTSQNAARNEMIGRALSGFLQRPGATPRQLQDFMNQIRGIMPQTSGVDQSGRPAPVPNPLEAGVPDPDRPIFTEDQTSRTRRLAAYTDEVGIGLDEGMQAGEMYRHLIKNMIKMGVNDKDARVVFSNVIDKARKMGITKLSPEQIARRFFDLDDLGLKGDALKYAIKVRKSLGVHGGPSEDRVEADRKERGKRPKHIGNLLMEFLNQSFRPADIPDYVEGE